MTASQKGGIDPDFSLSAMAGDSPKGGGIHCPSTKSLNINPKFEKSLPKFLGIVQILSIPFDTTRDYVLLYGCNH